MRCLNPLKPDLFVYLDGNKSISSRIVQSWNGLEEITSSFKDISIHVIIFDDKNGCEGKEKIYKNSVLFCANIDASNHFRDCRYNGSYFKFIFFRKK